MKIAFAIFKINIIVQVTNHQSNGGLSRKTFSKKKTISTNNMNFFEQNECFLHYFIYAIAKLQGNIATYL